jgi:hypothetical protein
MRSHSRLLTDARQTWKRVDQWRLPETRLLLQLAITNLKRMLSHNTCYTLNACSIVRCQAIGWEKLKTLVERIKLFIGLKFDYKRQSNGRLIRSVGNTYVFSALIHFALGNARFNPPVPIFFCKIENQKIFGVDMNGLIAGGLWFISHRIRSDSFRVRREFFAKSQVNFRSRCWDAG